MQLFERSDNMSITVDLGYMHYIFTNVIGWGTSTEMKGFVWISIRKEDHTTQTTYLPEKDIISLVIGGEKDDEK